MNTIKTLALALLIAVMGFAAKADSNTDDMIRQMLEPTAVLSVGAGNGSAIAIKVDPILGTFLVTNYHVVTNRLDDLRVQFYGETETYPVYVHSIDVQNDIAVVVTRHRHHTVAKIGKRPRVFDEVYCVGAPMGEKLAPSKGIVTDLDAVLYGTRHMTRTDCNIAPGNSGGGMFAYQDGEWKYIGMPAAVKMVRTMVGAVPITFLGMAVRIEDITWHLYRNGVLRTAPLSRRNSAQ